MRRLPPSPPAPSAAIVALRQIRANHPRVGVIMVTAQIDGDLAREALQQGAHDYITKPLDLRYLRTSVLVRVLLLVEE